MWIHAVQHPPKPRRSPSLGKHPFNNIVRSSSEAIFERPGSDIVKEWLVIIISHRQNRIGECPFRIVQAGSIDGFRAIEFFLGRF